MKQFYLTEIVTKDNLVHQGMYFRPKKFGKRALLWVHGLGSTFYGNVPLLEAFTDACEKNGIGFAAFNNRGHDGITRLKKIDPESEKGYSRLAGGAGVEVFEESVYDIDAGISFLAHQGFEEAVIAGISTGANKVCYYAGTQKDKRVKGVILVSPISDVPIESRSEHYQVNVKRMKALEKQKKGDSLISDISYMPLTPKRYLSLFDPGGSEDVFDYYTKQPKLRTFSCIKQPLCVVLAGADEYTDRSVLDILNVLKKYHSSANFYGLIIPDAFHSFSGKEKNMVSAILHWMREI